MKNYSQLLKELPAKSVVFAFGRFNPPTIGHELLVRAVRKLAQQRKADHVIYASASQDAKKNPLDVTKKIGYLHQMFPNTNFMPAGGDARTFLEVAKVLNKKYKNLIMIAGSDRVPEFKRLLNAYNGKEFHYDTIEVVSAGERDPDADDATGMSASKMRALAVKGDYLQFKRGLPTTIRDIDGRRLMNDIRQGMGLDVVKEQLNLVKDELRERYFRGEVFKLDDIVESAGEVYKIVKRGSNHLLLQDQNGARVTRWIQDVSETEKAFMVNEDLTDKTLKVNTDKIKVARIVATMLGIENAESMANPEQLVNNALRKARQKALNPEALKIVAKMLTLADEVGIKYDPNLKPQKLKEDVAASAASAKTAQRQSKMADLQAKQSKEKEDMISRQKKEADQLKGQLKISEDSPAVNTDSKYNIAKSIMRYSDFRKMTQITPAEDNQKIEDKETESDMDAMVDHLAPEASEVGNEIQPENHHLRRQKVKYHLGEGYRDYHNNRSGFAKRSREDDEYHTPDPTTRTHKIIHTVSKDGGEKHSRTVTISNSTKSHEEAKHTARAHLEKQGYTIHEARMSAAVKLQRAFEREQQKSAASRQRAQELLNPKKEEPKKTNEEVELDESMTDSWKQVQSMDKGSVLQGKEGAKKRLAYLNAVHAHHKKYGNDTKKVKKEIESINRSRIAEETLEQQDDREKELKRFKKQVKDFKLNEPQNEEYCPDEYASGQIELETPEEMSDHDIDAMLDSLTDDDYLEAYEDDELAIVDSETGEELPESEDEKKIDEQALNEILSRMERLRAKVRLRATKAKRERSTKLALKRYSDTGTINKRARRLAIKLMKQRMVRGRDINTLSVPEKERIERSVEKKKAIINRMAMKLTSRIRKVEKNRLSHHKVTVGSTSSAF